MKLHFLRFQRSEPTNIRATDGMGMFSDDVSSTPVVCVVQAEISQISRINFHFQKYIP